jgi:thiol-disulfide isomerase/thioredoxin
MFTRRFITILSGFLAIFLSMLVTVAETNVANVAGNTNSADVVTNTNGTNFIANPSDVNVVASTNVSPSATASSPVMSDVNNNALADLNNLVARIKEKIAQNKTDETNFADNLKEFDLLLAKHKDADVRIRGQILIMKAQLYIEVLSEPAKAAVIFKQIKQDFPELPINSNIDNIIAALEKRAKSQQVRDSLVPGAKFPDFHEKDLAGKPLSISQYKGKVVLVDFWATWCVPCLMTLPEIIQAYDKYHDKGLEVIGISLDQERPKLEHFIKDKSMKWPQYNDGEVWDSKLVQQYGVEAIPAVFLLDRKGNIIGKNLHGEELDMAIAQALKKKK